MKAKIKVDAKIEGSPAIVEIEIEFDKGEYVEVIREMPTLIKQARKVLKGE